MIKIEFYNLQEYTYSYFFLKQTIEPLVLAKVVWKT